MSELAMRVQLQAGYKNRCVLRDVHFDLHAGEALGLVGASGVGKTTLVMALLGLLPWRGGQATGEVLINGKNLLSLPPAEARLLRGKNISLIPQSPMTALNPAVSLLSHFEQAWRAHQPGAKPAFEARMHHLLEEVHLPGGEFLRKKPRQISVGQAQRVLIALALLHQPSILLADEPTSALDPVNQAEVVKLLRGLSRQHGTALLYISHDLMSVLQLCERFAVLEDGVLVESVEVAQIDRAQHPATLTLLSALPVPVSVLLAHAGAGAPDSGR
jgi:ABC-type glutathione transport system ATPase component